MGIMDGSNLKIMGEPASVGRSRLTNSRLSRTPLAASAMSVP